MPTKRPPNLLTADARSAAACDASQTLTTAILRAIPEGLDERTASILLDASMITATEAGARHGITRQTVWDHINRHRAAYDQLCATRDRVLASLADDVAAVCVVRIREALPSLTITSAREAQQVAALATYMLALSARLQSAGTDEAATRPGVTKSALQAAKLLQTIADKPPSQSCVTSHLPAKGPDNTAEQGQSAINPTSAKGCKGHVA